MGVYVFEPAPRDYVPRDARSTSRTSSGAPAAKASGSARCLYDGYWLDIGRHDDYEQAIAEYEGLLPQLLPADGPDALDG